MGSGKVRFYVRLASLDGGGKLSALDILVIQIGKFGLALSKAFAKILEIATRRRLRVGRSRTHRSNST